MTLIDKLEHRLQKLQKSMKNSDDSEHYAHLCSRESGYLTAFSIVKNHNKQLSIEHDLEERVNKFAKIMLDKLIKKSRDGWNDWQDCPPDVFRKSLIEHIEKGDPIDVANIAFFLYQLKASTNKPIENLIDADVIQDEYQ